MENWSLQSQMQRKRMMKMTNGFVITSIQGQLTDWSGRKLHEPDEDFIHRCVDTVKSITAPKQAHVKNVAPTVTYRRKR